MTNKRIFYLKIVGVFLLLLLSRSPDLFAEEQNKPHLTSILSTNYNQRLNMEDNIKQTPVPIGIYDVGYVVYSKEFAERFGYPPEYVTKLDKGMNALEFRMHSNGGFVECHLNTLLDNTLGLDLPEQDYQSRFEQQGDMIRFPKKLDSYKDEDGHYKERQEDKEFRMNVSQEKWHYYSRNVYLASYDYAPGKRGTWSSSYLFENYTNKYIKGMDYVSIFVTCGGQPYNQFQLKDISLWFKKIGGYDYTKTTGAKPEQFIKFRIPESFAQKAAELMEPVTKSKYSFFGSITSKYGAENEGN